MLNLNSALCAAGERSWSTGTPKPPSPEVCSHIHSNLALSLVQDRNGLTSLSWQAALQNLPTVRVPGFSLQARKGLWDLTQPSEGLCQGSQRAHGASQQSPFSSSSVPAQPSAAMGQLLRAAPHPASAVLGSPCSAGNQNVSQNPLWSHTKTDIAETALNSLLITMNLECKSTSAKTRAEI